MSSTFPSPCAVGGGAAGSVLAARLSEVPCVSVLLLEAGKQPPLLSDVPVVASSFAQSDVDWKYRTTPQKHTGEALVGRVYLVVGLYSIRLHSEYSNT